jgi:hypothetical protein
LQVVPTGSSDARTYRREVSALWFAWPKRRVMFQTGLDSGGEPRLRKGGKGVKLGAYVTRDEATGATIMLYLRCRLAGK